MIRLDRRKYLLRIAEVYFRTESDPPLADFDVAYLHQSCRAEGRAKAFQTLHIDLRASEEELLSGCSDGNRYKVKRAASRDGLDVRQSHEPTDEEIDQFIGFYDGFAAVKGLAPASRARLTALRAVDGLILSRIGTAVLGDLCHHAYARDSRRARLLHSASRFRDVADSAMRSLIGRANRLLHWRDIVHCKALGLTLYDFGGLALDASNEELSNIDQFKLSFGGGQVTEFNCVVPGGALGRVALFVTRST